MAAWAGYYQILSVYFINFQMGWQKCMEIMARPMEIQKSNSRNSSQVASYRATACDVISP